MIAALVTVLMLPVVTLLAWASRSTGLALLLTPVTVGVWYLILR